MPQTNDHASKTHHSARFAIIVDFELKAGTFERFQKLVLVNAAASLGQEPGCRRFDVLAPQSAAADRLVLYEVYDDESAFEEHKRTRHYREFDSATRDLVAGKTVRRFVLCSDSEAG